ncbi:MAG: TRAP transporter large permease subunit [Desulfobacterales bacterium]|nr:TRAP transporter large permease subunit [Desulfobacterales bacterium]
MSLLTVAIIAIIAFALIEAPLFAVIAALSMVCLYAVDADPMAIQTVLIEMNRLASMPVLVALPLFTFVGCLLTETQAPRRIMNFMQAAMGWLPGGLAIAAVCSCAFFTALTGASGVTIVAVGGVLYPILRQRDYSEKFTLGLLTTSGSRGLLFPPSLPIILYGVVAQIDIQQLFTAALIPGILSILVMSAYAFANQVRTTQRPREPVSFQGLKTAFMQGLWDWPIVVIILVGVYGGFVTIAEVSVLVVVYVVVVECFILREISFWRQLPAIIIESTILSGAIIIILGVALGFTGYLVDEQIPNRILAYFTALTQSRLAFLAGLNVFLLFVGCTMDIFSAIIIVVPIIVPIAVQYGVDPVHLGIIFLMNLEIGYSTPPVGMNLFIASLKFKKPVTLLYGASVPYLILMLALLMLVTYLPDLSLCLLK